MSLRYHVRVTNDTRGGKSNTSPHAMGAKYHKMHQLNYSPSMTGRLISIDDGQFAFVPNELPPALTSSWELSGFLSAADRALCQLAGSARNLPNPQLIMRPFIRREAVLSSQIEGTQCSISDLVMYEAIAREDPDSDVREVYNYILALERGITMLRQLPLCLRLIRDVHQTLLDGVRGRDRAPGAFRRVQNYVASPRAPIHRARYIPPPPSDMERLMNQLEDYINRENDIYPPLIRLALVHYQFEAVHPFEDGNGRVGRLLITLMLIAYRLLPSPLLYLSAYFEEHRMEYYDLLLAVSQSGAWEDWICFFLKGVEEQAVDAASRSEKIVDLWRVYRKTLQDLRAPTLTLTLLDSLFTRPTATLRSTTEMLDVTSRTAQQTIDRLIAAGMLEEATGKQRNRVYLAPAILRLMEVDLPVDASTTEPSPRTELPFG